MARKNPFVGGDLKDYIWGRRARDPDFAAEFDKLQLARQIRKLREAQGLTQEEMATRSGTKQSSIARLESGQVTPSIALLQKVARSLGLRLNVGFTSARGRPARQMGLSASRD